MDNSIHKAQRRKYRRIAAMPALPAKMRANYGRWKPMPLIDPLHEFVLFTNAKCGGTTLKHWFFVNMPFSDVDRSAWRLLKYFGPYFAFPYWLYGRRLFRQGIHDDVGSLRLFTDFYRKYFCAAYITSVQSAGYTNICVVRNPYDRVISSFIDKFCGDDLYQGWVQAVVAQSGNNGSLTFSQFLDYLEHVDDAACNPHWRRQTYILDGFRIDHFVRLEDLIGGMRSLGNIVGTMHLSILSNRLQAQSYAPTADRAIDLTEVDNLNLIAGRQAKTILLSKSSFLTPSTRERIAAIYAKDFELLPYAAKDLEHN